MNEWLVPCGWCRVAGAASVGQVASGMDGAGAGGLPIPSSIKAAAGPPAGCAGGAQGHMASRPLGSVASRGGTGRMRRADADSGDYAAGKAKTDGQGRVSARVVAVRCPVCCVVAMCHVWPRCLAGGRRALDARRSRGPSARAVRGAAGNARGTTTPQAVSYSCPRAAQRHLAAVPPYLAGRGCLAPARTGHMVPWSPPSVLAWPPPPPRWYPTSAPCSARRMYGHHRGGGRPRAPAMQRATARWRDAPGTSLGHRRFAAAPQPRPGGARRAGGVGWRVAVQWRCGLGQQATGSTYSQSVPAAPATSPQLVTGRPQAAPRALAGGASQPSPVGPGRPPARRRQDGARRTDGRDSAARRRARASVCASVCRVRVRPTTGPRGGAQSTSATRHDAAKAARNARHQPRRGACYRG